MTNQEAIERIQSIKSKVSLYYDVLALRMAEEALEDISEISEALMSIVEEESHYYGFVDTCHKAEKWLKENKQ